MRNTGGRKALEPLDQQLSSLHSGEGAKCVPRFPHLSDGDEEPAQSESGKHKGCLLFWGWSLSWDKGLGRIMLSHCGRKEGRELDRGESGGWRAIVHGCRLRSLPPPSSCLRIL